MAKITTATGSDADLTLEPDGTGDINLTPGTNGDVNIPANKGITFGNDGEKIEGNETKLDIAAAEIDFSIEAGGDINIGTDIGLTFGAAGEKIEGDGTDLTIASSADIDLTATNDVNIPAQVGLTFGADTEKIEADASNNVTLSAAGDIILDADGADVTLKDGGTTFGTLKQSSGDLVIQPASGEQIVLNEDGGSAALTIDTSGNTEITQNIEQADGKNIQTDEIRARDGDGLKLYDDSGAAGIFVKDGGDVGISTTTPVTILDTGNNNDGISNSGSYGGMVQSSFTSGVAIGGTATLSLNSGDNGGAYNGVAGILSISNFKPDERYSTHSVYAVVWGDRDEHQNSALLVTQNGSYSSATFTFDISDSVVTVTNTSGSASCRISITFIGGR